MFLKIKRYILDKRYRNNRVYRYLSLCCKDPSVKIENAEFVVFDTETTGLSIDEDQLISIGAVTIKNMRIDISRSFHRFLRIENLKRDTVKVHGITNDDISSKGEEPKRVIKDFLKYIRGKILVGFYVDFDFFMINKYVERFYGIRLPNYRIELLDVWTEEANIPGTLDDMANKLDVPIVGRHTALDDSYITAIVFLKLLYNKRRASLKSLPLLV